MTSKHMNGSISLVGGEQPSLVMTAYWLFNNRSCFSNANHFACPENGSLTVWVCDWRGSLSFCVCICCMCQFSCMLHVWHPCEPKRICVCVYTCSNMHQRRIHTIKLNRRQLTISVCFCQIPQQLLGLLYFVGFFERQAWRCSDQHELSVLTDRHLWINYRLCVLQSITEIAALHVWCRFYLSLVSTVGRYQNNFT